MELRAQAGMQIPVRLLAGWAQDFILSLRLLVPQWGAQQLREAATRSQHQHTVPALSEHLLVFMLTGDRQAHIFHSQRWGSSGRGGSSPSIILNVSPDFLPPIPYTQSSSELGRGLLNSDLCSFAVALLLPPRSVCPHALVEVSLLWGVSPKSPRRIPRALISTACLLPSVTL